MPIDTSFKCRFAASFVQSSFFRRQSTIFNADRRFFLERILAAERSPTWLRDVKVRSELERSEIKFSRIDVDIFGRFAKRILLSIFSLKSFSESSPRSLGSSRPLGPRPIIAVLFFDGTAAQSSVKWLLKEVHSRRIIDSVSLSEQPLFSGWECEIRILESKPRCSSYSRSGLKKVTYSLISMAIPHPLKQLAYLLIIRCLTRNRRKSNAHLNCHLPSACRDPWFHLIVVYRILWVQTRNWYPYPTNAPPIRWGRKTAKRMAIVIIIFAVVQ